MIGLGSDKKKVLRTTICNIYINMVLNRTTKRLFRAICTKEDDDFNDQMIAITFIPAHFR